MSKFKLPAVALLLIALVGAAPLTASAPLSASAATAASTVKVQSMDVKMIFDGVSIQPPAGQYTFIYNNSTYVPLRFMSYALQKSVSWDNQNKKVTVAEPASSELVVIKEYLMNAANATTTSTSNKSIGLTKVNASYVFIGIAKALPTGQSSFILNGSIYVPLRFISESVGHNITWDQKTKTVTATSAAYQEQGTGTNNPSTGIGSASGAGSSTDGATTGDSDAATTGTPTYEQITSDTQAKLSALQSQSESTLMSLALKYINAKDETTKSSLLAQGQQQLNTFTASFNSIISEAEQKLNKYGYSTAVISQYRAEFEAQLEAGKALAESMSN